IHLASPGRPCRLHPSHPHRQGQRNRSLEPQDSIQPRHRVEEGVSGDACIVIEIVVEHFLTDEGRQRFPAWIHEIGRLASRYPGFVDIQQTTPLDEPDRCLFRMSFKTRQDAQLWITSTHRQDVLALMEPQRVAELRATQWLTSESWSAST